MGKTFLLFTLAKIISPPLLLASLTVILTVKESEASSVNVIEQYFVRQKACPGKIVRPDTCPISEGSKSVIDCARGCMTKGNCASLLWNSGDKMCRFCNEVVSSDCMNNTRDNTGERFVAFEKLRHCGNENPNRSSENRCECKGGFYGDNCQKRMMDCVDWKEEGFPDGIYWIKPSETEDAFAARCNMKWGRTYIMHRANKTFDFYRGWNDYVKGFGDVSGDHWLGLSNLYALTNNSCHYLYLQFVMEDQYWRQVMYKNFKITDETQNFAMDFDDFDDYFSWDPAHALGDCLSYVKGQPFSTHDADHDDDVIGNCALRHQSGWWMRGGVGQDCTQCNPTGRLIQPADMKRLNVDDEVFWTPFADGSLSPWKVAMWLQECV